MATDISKESFYSCFCTFEVDSEKLIISTIEDKFRHVWTVSIIQLKINPEDLSKFNKSTLYDSQSTALLVLQEGAIWFKQIRTGTRLKTTLKRLSVLWLLLVAVDKLKIFEHV